MRIKKVKSGNDQGLDSTPSSEGKNKSNRKSRDAKTKPDSTRSSKWSRLRGRRGRNKPSNMALQLNKLKTPEQRKDDAVSAFSSALQQTLSKILGGAASQSVETLQMIKGEEFFLTFLSGGSWLTKIANNSKPYRRYFYFDKPRRVIFYEGSKKKRNQRAKYDTRDMIDVRKGYQSDVFNKCNGKFMIPHMMTHTTHDFVTTCEHRSRKTSAH